MPDRKRRRRRERTRRRDAGDAQPPPVPQAAAPTTPAGASPARQQPAVRMPSTTARATGFMIAVVTAFVSILTVADGITGDHSTAEATVRIAVGASLVALAVVVAVLALFPERLRDYFARRREAP